MFGYQQDGDETPLALPVEENLKNMRKRKNKARREAGAVKTLHMRVSKAAATYATQAAAEEFLSKNEVVLQCLDGRFVNVFIAEVFILIICAIYFNIVIMFFTFVLGYSFESFCGCSVI